jgi:hypothetical protein
LAFVIEDAAPWSAEHIDKDGPSVKRLRAFKEKIKNRMISFWSNADQLSAQVLTALSKEFAMTPRPGWIRAINIPGPEVLSELSRLSKENAELRARVSSESIPEFEILFAELMPAADEYRPHVIILVHYSGSPLYIPSNRCRLSSETAGASRGLKTIANGASSLIRWEGDDLQIEGSGYFDLVSIDTLPASDLGDGVGLALKIRLRSHEGVVLRVDLKPPNWRVGELDESALAT